MDARKTRKRETTAATSTSSSPYSFPFSLTKIAVSQICEAVGLKRSKPFALDALTTIAKLYIEHLSKSASSRAANSGRTQCNLFDIVHALEEFASPHGFPGASDVHQPFLQSHTLKGLSDFVSYSVELPFAKPFPSRRNLSLTTGNEVQNNASTSRGPEIPIWLPAFPDLRAQEECGNAADMPRYWEEGVVLDDNRIGVVDDRETVREGKKSRERKSCVMIGKAGQGMLPGKRGRVIFKIGWISGNVGGISN